MARLCLNCGEIYLDNSQLKCNYCNSTNTEIINSSITMGEYFELCKISKEGKFLKAMIDLHEKDIIEYELKMSQFRNQAEQQKSLQNAQNRQENNVPKCPRCGSTQIQMVPRRFSLLTGFATNKTDRVCVNCKYKW